MRRVTPIPMSDPMVVALLDDRKTQTRRNVKTDLTGIDGFEPHEHFADEWVPWKNGDPYPSIVCPYGGKPGDLLYVREAWTTLSLFDSLPPREIDHRARIEYLASGKRTSGRYRHARFMCRWMSRITLELTDVRVERLQDISKEDAAAEGFERTPHVPIDSRDWYRNLWESINGAGSWDENPWVWVLDFPDNVHQMNIDQFLKQRAA